MLSQVTRQRISVTQPPIHRLDRVHPEGEEEVRVKVRERRVEGGVVGLRGLDVRQREGVVDERLRWDKAIPR